MLPHHYKRNNAGYQSDAEDKYRKGSLYILAARYIKAILNDTKTRNVFFFLLLNITFTNVEFLYGWWTNSLGLLSDAVHMLFDSTALIFSLLATVIAKWEANERFTYGYGRVETLTGFANALALVFASVGIIWEGFERMFEPPKIKTDSLLTVSILGFLVNLVGIFAFDHGGMIGHNHSHGGHGHDCHGHNMDSSKSNNGGHFHEHLTIDTHDHHQHDHGGHAHAHGKHHHNHDRHEHQQHSPAGSLSAPREAVNGQQQQHQSSSSHNRAAAKDSSYYNSRKIHSHAHFGGQNPLMQGMFLHVLSDTLGSVGVIISTLLVKYYGWNWADPVVSLFIAGLTLLSIWPLLISSSYTLLQRIPSSIEGRTSDAFRKLSLMQGVVGFSNPHFWELCQNKNVGSIKVQVTAEANEEMLRMQIGGLFRELGIYDMVIQLEKDVVDSF